MEDSVPCPICGRELEELTPEEAKSFLHGQRKEYVDEMVFWCESCRTFLLEEDFLYNTEE